MTLIVTPCFTTVRTVCARQYPIKRTKKLSAPAHEAEILAYQDACARADIRPADTLRKLAKAVVEYVDKYGEFTFPVEIRPPQKK